MCSDELVVCVVMVYRSERGSGESIAATYIYLLSVPVSRRKVDEISGEELVLDE